LKQKIRYKYRSAILCTEIQVKRKRLRWFEVNALLFPNHPNHQTYLNVYDGLNTTHEVLTTVMQGRARLRIHCVESHSLRPSSDMLWSHNFLDRASSVVLRPSSKNVHFGSPRTECAVEGYKL
jgi:hypothetical protein